MELTVPAQFDDVAAAHNGLPGVWARMKIADLADRMSYDANGKLPRQIKQMALDYGHQTIRMRLPARFETPFDND